MEKGDPKHKMSDQEPTLVDDSVANKYRLTGELVNRTLKKLLEMCVDKASVRSICVEGDRMLLEESNNVLKKEKNIKRGVAFPTCVAVNNCINHYSPLMSDNDTILKTGDVVKIDMGAHVDGFIAVVGHTVVVGASKDKKVKGRKADVMLAAHYASEAALRLVAPGNENYAVTDTITKIAKTYKCKPIEGMLSFQLQKGRIDGEKTIIQNPTDAQRKEVEKQTFEKYEAYGVDVIVSTGEGRGKEQDVRVTVYRKTDEVYHLKLKASKEFFSQVSRNYRDMPFTLRAFDDEKKARMGVLECVSHKLIDPYPVLWEKKTEFVAQFKFTVLLMPNGQQKITGLPFDPEMFESDHKIEDPELQELLATNAKDGSKKAE